MSASARPEPAKQVRLSSAWREARRLIAANRGRLALGLVLVLVNRAAGLVLPWTSKLLIDDVVVNKKGELLARIAVLGIGATLVQATTTFVLAQLLGVAAQGAINAMRKRVQAHVLYLPLRWFDDHQTGTVISRIKDSDGIRNLVGNGLVQLVGSVITAVVALGVLFWLNAKLTLVILVVLGAFGACMVWAFRTLRPLFRKRSEIEAEVTGRLNQTLGGIRVVKAYTAEPAEERVFAEGSDRFFALVKRSIRSVSGTTAASIAITGVIGSTLTWIGGADVLAGRMTIGELVMYLVFVALVALPIVGIAEVGTQITEAFAGLDRIREILDAPREDEGDDARAPCTSVAGKIEFEDVGFEYIADKPVLHGVSFTARVGSTTALVGASGGGKSTLVGLVMAFHRPKSGRVLVDGRDLATLKLADYRAHLGVVMQDNFLFDGTIADNVAFARPSATRAEIEDACRLAHCEEFVKDFEMGYDTVVGERGIKLSGGQRQRVAIARALVANPRILVLDEATSSLDSESEYAIQEGLARLRSGRTTFVIAHRLSTIRSADQILVVEHGRIVERGTHAELMRLGGRYKELHDRQYRFETDRFVNPGEELVSELDERAPSAS
ncbi:MAG: ABC transporter ATP-binding protein [Planctomycetes bacterium]|nr:ABC transporter ATP-binding protein [Planctomycetota bacterium]